MLLIIILYDNSNRQVNIGGRMYKINRTNKEMIPVQNLEKGIEYLTYPSFTDTELVEHLVTTRLGGVSEGVCATMNVSFSRGDKPEAVKENFSRIGGLLNGRLEDFVFTHQTHTDTIRKVTQEDRGKGLVKPLDYQDIDGLITNEKGLILSTFYADCVPLLFLDTIHKAIGLAHSGWKGTTLKIGQKVLEAMKESYGTNPVDVLVAIGPSICVDCYEVSEDVAEEFKNIFPKEDVQTRILRPKANKKFQLDLWEANKEILLEANIKAENISVGNICTCCNPDYLFSHRASEGKRGNIGAFLSLK